VHSSKNTKKVFSACAKLRCSIKALKICVSKKRVKNGHSVEEQFFRKSFWLNKWDTSLERSDGAQSKGVRHFLYRGVEGEEEGREREGGGEEEGREGGGEEERGRRGGGGEGEGGRRGGGGEGEGGRRGGRGREEGRGRRNGKNE
jgi:hypothetical protein